MIYGGVESLDHVVEETGGTWNKSMMDKHIFLKELVAAKDAILRILATSDGHVHIRLGVDNSAMYHALLRMYSANNEAVPHLREIRDALRRRESLLSAILIRSEENASDAASRGRTALSDVAEECLVLLQRRLIEDGIKGIRRNTYNPEKAPKHCRPLRHGELLDEDTTNLHTEMQGALHDRDALEPMK